MEQKANRHQSIRLIVSVIAATALCACTGNNSGGTPNTTNQATAGAAMINNLSSSSDSTRYGFGVEFSGINAPAQVAFSPYYTAAASDPSSCPNAATIYSNVIQPTLSQSPSSTLAQTWRQYEYFNCNNAITKLVVAAINNAQKSIYAAVYDFNNPDIAYALIAKKKQSPKIDIEVIADQSNLTAANSLIQVLSSNNIPVYISSAYAIMHNKFMVFDGSSVEFGSFNYTTEAATQQANNAILVQSSQLAAAYNDRWQEILSNQQTAQFSNGQWKPSTSSYIPSGYSAPVQTTYTSSSAVTTPVSLQLSDAKIANYQELAATSSSALCPTDLPNMGGTCLPNQYEDPLVSLINSANQTIQIADMQLSDSYIASALENAINRGVSVEIVADNDTYQSQTQYSQLAGLAQAGASVRLNNNYEIMHNKYMIIDGQTVETGSYNLSNAAWKSNAENYSIFYDQPQLASYYQTNWQQLFSQGSALSS